MKTVSQQRMIGSALAYVQMGLGIVVGLIFSPIMIHLLGQGEYGLYNTVVSATNMLTLLNLGFGSGYIKKYAIYKQKGDETSIYRLNGMFTLVFSVMGIVALLCGIYLSFNLPLVFGNGLSTTEYVTAKILMILMTVNVAISFPMSVFSTIITASEKFVFYNIISILRTVVSPLITALLLLVGYKSVAMTVSGIIITLLIDGCYIFYVFAKLKHKFIFRGFEKGLLKSLFIYTSFIAINLVVDQLNWNVDKLLLARYRGTIEVAIYTVGFSMYTYYSSFSTCISNVFIPKIHAIVNENRDKKLQRASLTELFVRVGRIQFYLLALALSGFIFFGKYFITKIWVGDAYLNSYYVAILLMVAATIPLIQNVGIEIQRALNLHYFRSIVYGVMALANVFMTILLCSKYGSVGAAIGTTVSMLLANGLIMNIFYHKRCNIDIIYFWKNILSIIVRLSIVFAFGIVLVRFVMKENIVSFLVCVVLYSVVYLVDVVFFCANQQEKQYINAFVSKVMRRKVNNE